jgi:hypothetical protein
MPNSPKGTDNSDPICLWFRVVKKNALAETKKKTQISNVTDYEAKDWHWLLCWHALLVPK